METLYLIGGLRTEELEPGIAGNKAANLARMAAIGLPVPPAFVVPNSLCAAINAGEQGALDALDRALGDGMRFLEEQTGRRFGDRRRPLLVSVRSGAPYSMPGMLETVLDVGCTSEGVHGLVRMSGNPRFAWDCRRRFLQGYSETVLGLDPRPLESKLAGLMAEEAVASDSELDGETLERFAAECLGYATQSGADLPDDAYAQLHAAARAVYRSWESDKAKAYRRLTHLVDGDGTAVTVQAMVFGNMGRRSGAGVAFSRDPSTGERAPVVDLLFEAQGEDVVSGRRTPCTGDVLAARLPAVSAELLEALARLEAAFRDVQDVEFTIENGRLWPSERRGRRCASPSMTCARASSGRRRPLPGWTVCKKKRSPSRGSCRPARRSVKAFRQRRAWPPDARPSTAYRPSSSPRKAIRSSLRDPIRQPPTLPALPLPPAS
jgi:pyruvate,orthophosphate dikinase